MLTDSHCHLASHRFDPAEVSSVIARAHAAGVGRLVTLATSLDDLRANLELARNDSVHACIGIHPCEVHDAPENAVEVLAGHTGDPRVCGIGETGLDYFHPAPAGWSEHDFRERQRRFLRQHFEIAFAAGLNLVIHTRDKSGDDSFQDALSIFQEHHQHVRAVFHCFIGPWENARRVVDLGGLVSFGGVATFKNAAMVRESVANCPAGSFMVETDAPYLAPEPHRGQRNEPAFSRHTAERIAAIRGESVESLARHTTATAATFFRFRAHRS